MPRCDNCGSAIGRHGCEYCNEELYIMDQYYELEMPLPAPDSEFMKAANEQQSKIDSGELKTIFDYKNKTYEKENH